MAKIKGWTLIQHESEFGTTFDLYESTKGSELLTIFDPESRGGIFLNNKEILTRSKDFATAKKKAVKWMRSHPRG